MEEEHEAMEVSGDNSSEHFKDSHTSFSSSQPGRKSYSSPRDFKPKSEDLLNSANKRRSLQHMRSLTNKDTPTGKGRNFDTPLHDWHESGDYSRFRGKTQGSKIKSENKPSMTSTCDHENYKNEDITGQQHGHSHSHKHKELKRRPKAESMFTLKQKVIVFFALIAIYVAFHYQYRSYIMNRKCQVSLNLKELHDNLYHNVFGQEIAVDVVFKMMKNLSHHLEHQSNSSLGVLSLHGWTGVGKNYVASMISKSFSRINTKVFLVPSDFPHAHLDSYYKEVLPMWIQTNISRCRMNVFIFDEMDKATPGVVEALSKTITNMKTSLTNSHGVWTLFVLLSNSKSQNINKYFFQQMSEGRQRISISYEELQPILLENVHKSWYADLHMKNLIDKFVPFLPLHRDHVHQCIKKELFLKGRTIDKEILELVDGELSFVQPYENSKFYSSTGCKRVSDKVDYHYSKL